MRADWGRDGGGKRGRGVARATNKIDRLIDE